LASRPVEASKPITGATREIGVAVNVKSFSAKDLVRADNYEFTAYALRGRPDEGSNDSSGLNLSAGINVGYLGRSTALDDLRGRATVHVGAILDFGLSETITEKNTHGTSFMFTPLGFALGTTTYRTETSIDFGEHVKSVMMGDIDTARVQENNRIDNNP
jgi:hypothetical protein